MEPTLESLLEHKKQLYQRLASLGEFRRGSISSQLPQMRQVRTVGVPSRGIPGTGPVFVERHHWGKESGPQSLLGAGAGEKSAQRWRTTGIFQRWSQAWVEVNEQICERRPVGAVAEESELEQLKKKLQGNTAGSGTRDKPATGRVLRQAKPDLEALEMAIRDSMHQMGSRLLEKVINADQGGYGGPRLECGPGPEARFLGYRERR